jgi:DNA polymerase II small subunit
METLTKKEMVQHFLDQGVLLTPDILEAIKGENFEVLEELCKKNNLMIINNEVSLAKDDLAENINWKDFESQLAEKEKGKRTSTMDITSQFKPVQVLFSYQDKGVKPTVQNFISYFLHRYNALEGMLAHRPEMTKLMSISKLANKRDPGVISVIGLVQSVETTKNGHLILTIEDPTGTVKVLITKSKNDLFEEGKMIVVDEVLGVCGSHKDGMIFANELIQPDVPLNSGLKKGPEEEYVIFLSDIHVGSTYFLGDDFKKFLKWINQESGSQKQKDLAAKVKYIFIAGDLVDGVGIYPNQDTELEIKDIYKQYEACAELLKQIPERIPLIICGGNHDAMRLSEPQPVLSPDYAKSIWDLPNVTMVSNPSYVRIGETPIFPGFDVLMYHGYSFDYYVANVDSIRNSGGYDRADLIMKFLLKKRHLGPSHTSTLYVADSEKDNLVIDKIPDFFITGHIHKTSVSHYRNITLICGSCWQSTTTFQEKLGHHPEPSRVPLVNLKTREVKVLRFGD